MLQAGIDDLQQALSTIQQKAEVNTIFDSSRYYEQKLEEIHTQCVNAYPGCCKADRATPFGISLFVGSGFVLGAATTYAIMRLVEKTAA